MSEISDNREFLTTQIITYLGNKRSLLGNIEKEIDYICKSLKKEKLFCVDLFSGSGIVARMLKRHSEKLFTNDLETYSSVLNSCYLTNKEDFPQDLYFKIKNEIERRKEKGFEEGLIAQNYAPKDDENIQRGERVFYTRKNALLLDTYRGLIDQVTMEICGSQYFYEKDFCKGNFSSESYYGIRKFFLAPLLTEASVHVNTSGVFKGFYKDKNTGLGCFGASGKDALKRILGEVELKTPVFSNFNCEVKVFKKDAVELSRELKNVDVVYLDPPYNQHPYGSNYFMLNLILKNKIDSKVSEVSGIPEDWNRSDFNKKVKALSSMEKIVSSLDSKYLVISYNSEGFIKFSEMSEMLEKYGKLKTVEIPYNTFRGSRNLQNRDLYVSEYLFVLEKLR